MEFVQNSLFVKSIFYISSTTVRRNFLRQGFNCLTSITYKAQNIFRLGLRNFAVGNKTPSASHEQRKNNLRANYVSSLTNTNSKSASIATKATVTLLSSIAETSSWWWALLSSPTALVWEILRLHLTSAGTSIDPASRWCPNPRLRRPTRRRIGVFIKTLR